MLSLIKWPVSKHAKETGPKSRLNAKFKLSKIITHQRFGGGACAHPGSMRAPTAPTSRLFKLGGVKTSNLGTFWPLCRHEHGQRKRPQVRREHGVPPSLSNRVSRGTCTAARAARTGRRRCATGPAQTPATAQPRASPLPPPHWREDRSLVDVISTGHSPHYISESGLLNQL